VTEYLGQIYHGTIDDEFLDRVLDVVDPKTILWGSDFPHARCTYPKTLEVIDRVFSKLKPEMKGDLTLRNAARVYNIAVPAAVADH
jgi:predicted TIM-barrel fold metal-dependent hydrolase